MKVVKSIDGNFITIFCEEIKYGSGESKYFENKLI